MLQVGSRPADRHYLFLRLVTTTTTLLPRRDGYSKLANLHKILPIRILFPGQGFWRDYLGPDPSIGE